MSRRWRFIQLLGGTFVATVALAIVLPGHRGVVLAGGVMAMLALLLVEMGSASYRLAARRDEEWERVRHVSQPKPERPADLERIELQLSWGKYSAGDFNYRVRPMLRRLAAHRLRDSHAVEVERRPEDARAHVSAELWDYVIAKQSPDDERVLGTADIARMVDEIERI